MEKTRTIIFGGTVPAGGEAWIYSRRMPCAWALREIYVSWPSGCNRLVEAHPYVTQDNTAPASGPPLGTNLLTTTSVEPYLVGDGDYRQIKHTTGKQDAGGYLCFYCVNNDGIEHTIDAYMTVTDIEQ